jgi:hypothetical protein
MKINFLSLKFPNFRDAQPMATRLTVLWRIVKTRSTFGLKLPGNSVDPSQNRRAVACNTHELKVVEQAHAQRTAAKAKAVDAQR